MRSGIPTFGNLRAEPAVIRRAKGQPLLPVRGVCSLLSVDEDVVVRLIESGDLLWAWNFGSTNCRQREIRILPAAVSARMRSRECGLDWDAVLPMVLPAIDGKLNSTELRIAFNVSQTHLSHLAERREIRIVTPGRTGPGGVAWFTAESVVEFLKSRRM